MPRLVDDAAWRGERRESILARVDPLLPEDIAVVLALAEQDRHWSLVLPHLRALISTEKLDEALRRLAAARLCHPRLEIVVLPALARALQGVPFLFPAQLGALSRGVPTAWCEPSVQAELRLFLGSTEQRVVWSDADGEGEGRALEPLAPWVPSLAREDPGFSRRMALLEILRVGRARERTWATARLRGWELAA
jgi:hypothetical protein